MSDMDPMFLREVALQINLVTLCGHHELSQQGHGYV